MVIKYPQGIGGVIVATINIVLLAFGGDQVEAAFYCFLFSVIFLIGSIFALVYLMKTPLYQQCIEQNSQKSLSVPDEASQLLEKETGNDSEQVSVHVMTILKKIKVEALTVLIIYIVTLGLFPAVTVLVESTNADQAGAWEKVYFVPVVCFLFYNIGDYLGRLIAGSSRGPKICSKLALALSLVRVAFVPLMLFCNLAPTVRRHIPVYFDSDTAYIVIMFLLSMSNGYLTSIVMVNAPKKVLPHEQQTASNLMVGLLGLGLITGAMLSAALVNIL